MSDLLMKVVQETEMIELSDAIQTILDGSEKENELLPSSFLSGPELKSPRARYMNAILESPNIDNTPHDGRVFNSSRGFCRRLDRSETTPVRKRESRLNSVNILCRSKKRKLERHKSESSLHEQRKRLTSYLESSKLDNSGMRVVESLSGFSDSGVMLEDAGGHLHPAEFVPLMVEERGGFCVTSDKKRCGSKSHGSGKKCPDDSLTNITWLRQMSAPEVEPTSSTSTSDSQESQDRPPYSYSALIQFALISTPSGKMTLKDIYEWIQVNFPYFKTAKLGWKNSIRHNLSLHKIFIREAPDGPGKPAFWTLKPGTVVRLPENRLFIMEGNVTTDCSHKIPQSYAVRTGSKGANIMRTPDGNRVHLSPSQAASLKSKIKPEPTKHKPILPRVTTPCATLVSLPMIVSTNQGTATIIPSSAITTAISSKESYQPQPTKKGRYQKIAPRAEKNPPLQTVLYESIPIDGYDSGLGTSADIFDVNMLPDKWASKRKSKTALTVPMSPPSMSTPLKAPSSTTSLFENLGNLTPIEDFTNIRGGSEDFLSITPIKSSGMTPVLRDILNNSSDLELSPPPSSRRGRKLMTPRKVVTEKSDFNGSFNFDELFGSPDLNEDGFSLSLSFNNLFSPQK